MSAYSQRHSAHFAGPYAEPGDRHLCPCRCGRILSRAWFKAITGQEPEAYVPPVERWRDPSDDVRWLEDHRSAR